VKDPYQKGLCELADGIHGYLQPNGSWGLNNAGLIHGKTSSILVDTLFDLHHTREMLAALRARIPQARTIGTVVNTHANGDHCWGNQEVAGANIVASARGAQEMAELPPSRVAWMVRGANAAVTLGPLTTVARGVLGALRVKPLHHMLTAAPFVARIFAGFDFGGIDLTLPTQTFEKKLTLTVDDRAVELLEVGPAHTQGDVMVHIPDAGVLFGGDILFIDSHPVVWAGPISNWVAALDTIRALQPKVIVPGHGPLTNLAAVTRLKEYLVYVDAQATQRHAAGMDALTAAKDIALDGYRDWLDAERIAVNVDTVYRHLEGRTGPVNVVEMFARMALVARAVRH
jgi:cyclase